MIDTRLILIDGMTGAGKSTTAQRLWLHLERLGVAARWIYEHDTSHPLWETDEMQRIAESGALAPGFAERTLPARWRRLGQRCAESGAATTATILESALLQSTVGLLLAMNADDETIVESALACAEAAAAANPVLVWLRPGDVPQALRAVCDVRRDHDYEAALVALLGATPYGRDRGIADFDGLVGFYERWRGLAEAVIARLAIPVCVVDAVEWTARDCRITDFLALPPIDEPRVRVDGPARFVGRFVNPDADHDFVVAGDENGLHFDNPRLTRLIPWPEGDAAARTFLVGALCLEVAFDDERDDGRFHRFELRGPLPGLKPEWRRTDDAPMPIPETPR